MPKTIISISYCFLIILIHHIPLSGVIVAFIMLSVKIVFGPFYYSIYIFSSLLCQNEFPLLLHPLTLDEALSLKPQRKSRSLSAARAQSSPEVSLPNPLLAVACDDLQRLLL